MIISNVEIEHTKGHTFLCDIEIELHNYINTPAKTNGDPLSCYEADYELDYDITEITLAKRFGDVSRGTRQWVWCNHLESHIDMDKLNELVEKECENNSEY